MAQNIETQIADLKKRVKATELKEVQIQTKIEAAEERLAEAQAKCQEHGVEPDQLEATIAKLEKQMGTIANSIEELLPDDRSEAF